MKNKETLEEAAERLSIGIREENYKDGIIDGAKWQQEQDKNKYSEEDMRKMYDFGSIGHFTENESLEQFKNK